MPKNLPGHYWLRPRCPSMRLLTPCWSASPAPRPLPGDEMAAQLPALFINGGDHRGASIATPARRWDGCPSAQLPALSINGGGHQGAFHGPDRSCAWTHEAPKESAPPTDLFWWFHPRFRKRMIKNKGFASIANSHAAQRNSTVATNMVTSASLTHNLCVFGLQQEVFDRHCEAVDRCLLHPATATGSPSHLPWSLRT